jgi:MFS family permease/rhodanese-related sulfurtransferase
MTPEIDAETLMKWIGQNVHATILDIRTPIDRDRGFIPGSIHLNVNAALENQELHAIAIANRNVDDRIVTVCESRALSHAAAEKLRSLGFDAYSLRGGMDAWTRVGGSLEQRVQTSWPPFLVLMVVNAFVGSMVGMERTLLPLIAERDFGLISRSVILTFIISFGIVKAVTNLFAGYLADRFGRRAVLIAGWLIGAPVPLLIMAAPDWSWVVFANVLLGLNQGLCWSMTVVMMIDIVGPRRRGLAMGLNEFAGYAALSATALLTGYLATAYGLRPWPFLTGVICVILGLTFSLFLVAETDPTVASKKNSDRKALNDIARSSDISPKSGDRRRSSDSFMSILFQTTWRDRDMFAACQAGMATRLNDGIAWGLLPLLFSSSGLSIQHVALLVAIYPGVWGLGQLVTGVLSDLRGRKGLIVAGMTTQALGMAAFAVGKSLSFWIAGSVFLGLGAAAVYPTLIAAVSDKANPRRRASIVGVYRLWRDSGYALGAVLSGLLADAFNVRIAIASAACVTILSGFITAISMKETLGSVSTDPPNAD